MIPRLHPWFLAGILLLSASSVPGTFAIVSGSSLTTLTTSGPETSLTSPKTLSAPTPSSESNATTPKLNRVGDLAESQSSQSSSVVHAPVGHSTSAFQQEQYRNFLQRSASHSPSTQPSTSSSSTVTSVSTANPKEISTTASQPRGQLMTANSGKPMEVPIHQQNLALMRAKPGQFTLVSNQQIGPGHVTMIGYTTPIVKVGGIVKIDQVAPGQVRSHQADSSATHPGTQASASSASSAIYTSRGASSLYSPTITHHSLINHAVPKPQHEVSHDLRVGTHAAMVADSPRQGPSARQAALAAAPPSYESFQASPGSSQMYFDKQAIAQLQQGYAYGAPESRQLGLTYQFAPEQQQQQDDRSAKLQQAGPMMSPGGGMTFSAPMEKPKPFLVYKPGYMEKVKSHQAAYPPPMMSMPQYLQSSPLSPISMAHLSQPKAQIEKHGHSLNNVLPIQDLDSNELGGGPMPGQVPAFESQRTQFPLQTMPQMVHPGQQTSLSAHLAQSRPISIAKQMTMDALAQQRSHILSAHMRPEMMMHQHQQQQIQQQQQPQYLQQQQLPPQMPNPFQSEQPKMFGQPMESPLAQFAQQMQLQAPPYERSANMRPMDQAAGYQIPQPQVTSSIRMPEPSQKVDPQKELEDQIKLVLQNSPNLSENSRHRHRGDIMKAVQESFAESDNSASRQALASPKQQHQQAYQPQQQSSISQGPSPFDLGGGLSLDGLVSQSYSSRPDANSESQHSNPFAGPSSKLTLDTPFMASNFKPTHPQSVSSRYAPESGNYFARYNQESSPFLPQDASPESRALASATHSAAQSSAALNRGYKAKLQQEIQRYLSDQMNPAKSDGSAASLFGLSQDGVMQSPSQQALLKYQSSPLRKMVNLVERQPQSQQAMLLDSQRSRESQSQGTPNHFVLARHTEFVQSQASQPSRTEVKAPASASSSGSASATSSSKAAAGPSAKSSAASHYSALASQLAQAASSSASPESAKTLRGYSEWWKESAASSARALAALYASQQ